MKFEPVDVKLKDAKTITIREATVDDAEELLKVVKEYAEESQFIPYIKGEFSISLEDQKKWIESFNVTSNGILLVATYEDHIIGNISLNISVKKMLQHTGTIGVGLLEKWRGQGIGSKLFENLIQWAIGKSTLEILWLETDKNNVSGKALYKKFGFTEVGLFPRFIKHSNGEYSDSMTMILNLQ